MSDEAVINTMHEMRKWLGRNYNNILCYSISYEPPPTLRLTTKDGKTAIMEGPQARSALTLAVGAMSAADLKRARFVGGSGCTVR